MLKMFTVYDSKAETYLRPFSMLTTGEAIRGFITTLNDPQTEYCKYPADFTLFEVGTFDETKAAFVIHEAMVNLGNGLHLKSMGQPQQPPTDYAEAVRHDLKQGAN